MGETLYIDMTVASGIGCLSAIHRRDVVSSTPRNSAAPTCVSFSFSMASRYSSPVIMVAPFSTRGERRAVRM